MPPKKTSAAKKEVKKNVQFENRKEEILDEAEDRMDRMREMIAQRTNDILKRMLEAIESLDPSLLNMTVGEFMQMPVACAEEKENDDVRSAKETRAAREAREMTVADHEMARPNEIQQTAVRPLKAGRVMELRTPAGKAFRVPSMITPRVGGGSMTTRAIRPDEVAFSAAGSPIVMGDAMGREIREESAEFDQLHQLVNANEDALSPNTRHMVQTLKTFMHRKALGDPV